jgi:Spy/CpxP family protein refolding chaperone
LKPFCAGTVGWFSAFVAAFGCHGGFGGGFGFGAGFGGGGFGRGGGGFGAGFGGGGFGNAGGFGSCKLDLLTQKSVQKDLKLSKKQLKDLNVIHTKHQEGTRRLFANMRFDTLLKESDALPKKYQELAETTAEAVEDILTSQQRKRLREISWQQRGRLALSDPEAAEALKLTEEQRQNIQDIQADAAKEMRAEAMKQMQGAFDLGGNPFDVQKALAKMQNGQKTLAKLQKSFAELQKNAGETLLDVLTTEQRTRWKELLGKPFKEESRKRGKSR